MNFEFDPLIQKFALALGVGLAGFAISLLVSYLIVRRHKRRPVEIGDFRVQIDRLPPPLRLLLPAIALLLALPWIDFPAGLQDTFNHGLQLWVIAAVAWLMQRIVVVIRELLQEEYPVDVADNLHARRVQTQFQVISRIITILIGVIAVAASLMTFESVRQFGVSLLASAGVLGIVLGFAAQETLGTLISGIQIAITQPIRLDDVVIVDGTYGRIQEITLTYVVINTWDERNLIVPIRYFLENVFENWTYTESRILGTVYLYTDYAVPIERVRAQLERVLKANELWDGRMWNLQVTDSTERGVELRALMSAPDSASAWNLRVQVREKMVEFLQREYPDSLPVVRLLQVQEPSRLDSPAHQSQDGS